MLGTGPVRDELPQVLVDEEAGRIFCLVEADNAEAANTIHQEAHGLEADEIYPVSEHT